MPHRLIKLRATQADYNTIMGAVHIHAGPSGIDDRDTKRATKPGLVMLWRTSAERVWQSPPSREGSHDG